MQKINPFIKKIVKLFNKYYPWSAIFVFALIVLLAYWQLVNLYFWADDWDLFLRVAHPNLELWGMKPGWIGSGPYRYLHTPFMPFYPFFGLNAAPYFAGEILIYFIATVSVFLLSLELTSNKKLSFAIASIYGSLGYIGSYTLFHLSNTFQNVGAVVFTTLTLWILARYYHSKKVSFYLLSLLLFYLSLEVENLRSHGLIFLVFGLMLIYARFKKSLYSIFINFLIFSPFVIIYKQLYSATISSNGETTVGSFFYTMVRDNLYPYFIYPFASFANVIAPDHITKFIYSFFGNTRSNLVADVSIIFIFLLTEFMILKKNVDKKKVIILAIFFEIVYFFFERWAMAQSLIAQIDPSSGFISLIGMSMLLIFMTIIFCIWKKQNNMARLILFGIVLIFGHYIGYFIGIPSYSYLITTDRYLTPSTVGTAVLLGGLFYLSYFRKKHLFFVFTFIYSAYLILAMNVTIYRVVNEISNPTKKLYADIQKITPSLPENPVLYLDFENDPNLEYQVNSSFPPTAFALFYKQPNRVPGVRTFGEYLYKVKNGEISIDNLASYYISSRGVVETSSLIKKLLKNTSSETFLDINKITSNTQLIKDNFSVSTSPVILSRENDSVGINPRIETSINYSSVVPMMLSINLTATKTDFSLLKFPYYDATSQMPDDLIKEDLQSIAPQDYLNSSLPCSDTSTLLRLDKERKDFLHFAKIETSSEATYSEKEFLTDDNFKTNWSSNPLHWASVKKEDVVIDLSEKRNVGKLIWINYLSRPTPTDYSIYVSDNKNDWKKVKEVKNGPRRIDGEIIVEEFPVQGARFIKMEITNTFGNLAPAISEIWVSSINEDFAPQNYIQQLIDYPMLCPIKNISSYQEISNILGENIRAKIWWQNDSWQDYNSKNTKNIEVIADGLPHNYDIYIPASGTKLEKIQISDLQLPLNISVNSISVRSLSFQELNTMGHITKTAISSN